MDFFLLNERIKYFPSSFLSSFRRHYHLPPVEGGPRPIKVAVRRSRLLEDALAALVPIGGSIRGPLNITFIDARGMTVSFKFFLIFVHATII